MITPNLIRRSPRVFQISEQEAASTIRKMRESCGSIELWRERRRMVREGILSAARLNPLPNKQPLFPIIRDRKRANGYTVENIAIETFPGFYCTGNLYRPTRSTGVVPAVLCPHGHFAKQGGRFSSAVQTRCARLAQMGALAIAYDMVGWGEALQVSHGDDYAFTYQLWNGMRVVDFLLGLEEVDASRIGISGCSGGGTQAFMLTAVDDRIALSVPVAMVSAHFFGGCICESGMPVHEISKTNNAEIAALAAPRPQLLVSVGTDFTRNTPDVEFPFIRHIYDLYGAALHVENVHLPEEEHDYGYSKRQALYAFVAKHFQLETSGDSGSVERESPETVVFFSKQELSVFTESELRDRCKPMGLALRDFLSRSNRSSSP